MHGSEFDEEPPEEPMNAVFPNKYTKFKRCKEWKEAFGEVIVQE